MAIQNCKRCDTLFNKLSKDICPKCVSKEEEDFKKVRMYIKRHRTVEMHTVSKETGVDIDVIYQFLQDGRIVLGDSSAATYPCKTCGSPIQSGSICGSCSADLENVQNAIAVANAELKESASEPQRRGAFHTRD